MELNFRSLPLLTIGEAVKHHPLSSRHDGSDQRVVQAIDEEPDVVVDSPLHVDAKSSNEDFVDPLCVTLNSSSSPALDRSPVSTKKPSSSSAGAVSVTTKKKAAVDDVIGEKLTNTLAEVDESVIPDLDPKLVDFTPWSVIRADVLREFQASDTLSIKNTFLGGRDQKTGSVIKLSDLTQNEFEARMRDLRRLLLSLWSKEKRIDCIQLAVEVSKQLSSISNAQYYPSLFVHVTDFLDVFGALVYDRLLTKARAERLSASLPALPTHFVTSDILAQTRLTARNWFGKIQMIDEVLPRIYVECALIRCMRFVDDSSISPNIMRLGSLARVVQHPLISSYARCFICRTGMRLDPANRAPHWLCINDWMQMYVTQPAALVAPAVQYVLQCVCYGAVTYNDLLPIWEYCAKPQHREVILVPFINAVSKIYVAEHALDLSKLVTSIDTVSSEALCALGRRINTIDVEDRFRKSILRSIWRVTNQINLPSAFLASVDVWMEFVAKHFSVHEVAVILDFTTTHVSPSKVYEYHLGVLSSIASKAVAFLSPRAVPELMVSDAFVHFIDLFRGNSAREQMATCVLTAFVKATRLAPSSSDLRLASIVLDLCRMLHDSLDVDASEQTISTCAELIESALDRFNLPSDPERGLDFLIECRGTLMNIDSLQRYVVYRIIHLTVDVARRSRLSTAQTAFLHACIANLYITIPSLRSSTDRIHLGVLAGFTSLSVQIFHYAESFLTTAVDDWALLDASEQDEAISLAQEILTLLVTMPEPVERSKPGPLTAFGDFLDKLDSLYPPGHRACAKPRLRILLAALQAILVRGRIYDPSVVIDFALFRWVDRSRSAAEHVIPIIDSLTSRIINLLAPVVAENDSAALEVVEIVATFTTDQVAEELALYARDCYKRCKRYPEFRQRLALARKK